MRRRSFNVLFSVCVENYPFAGQNIAYRRNSAEYEEKKSTTKEMITAWFNEYVDASMSDIKFIHLFNK